MKNRSKRRTVIFALLPTLLLVLVCEIALRCYYFQFHTEYPLALNSAFESLTNHLASRFAHSKAESDLRQIGSVADKNILPQELLPKISKALYTTPAGAAVITRFQQEYEHHFARLAEECLKIQSKLLVLYIPSSDLQKLVPSREACRTFFHSLALKYNVDYLDVTQIFKTYPTDWLTLLPENAHLSRFGHKIVAGALSDYLSKNSAFRSPHSFQERPAILGDLKPDKNSIWTIIPDMPYRVISNAQGFRMKQDITFPKQKQRILILGDSFTFGPYIDNHDTYPALLNKAYPDKAVINAAICGYTITDEASLFLERAKYADPDITVLQVLDNDITGFFYFKQNEFDRKRQRHAPTKAELDLFQTLE